MAEYLVEVGEGIFSGYLKCKGSEFPVCIRSSQNNKITLECGEELKRILGEHVATVLLRLQQHDSVHDFVADLHEIVSNALENGDSRRKGKLSSMAYYRQVIQELNDIGWDSVKETDEDIRTITISCWDSHKREHLLKLNMPDDYPQTFPVLSASLPAPFEPKLSKRNCSLKAIKNEFEKELDTYQQLWNFLDDIDRNTWVLEPKQADRSILFRRIVIGDNCSIHINVSAQAPSSICECHFLGSEDIVKPLRENFNLNAHAWSWKETLRQNLSRILEIDFPKATTSNKASLKMECGICYSFRLRAVAKEVTTPGNGNGSNGNDFTLLPNRVCDNKKCGRPYHESCLSQWLQALPETRYSFDTMFGKCPYCAETISIRSSCAASMGCK